MDNSSLQKSRWPSYWSWLGIAILLLALLALILDYWNYRQNIGQYYAELNGADKAAERESALFLTQHCLQRQGKLTSYLTYRTSGQYCHSLSDRKFNQEATLSGINLRVVDLSDANLISADLISADLSYTDLSYTDLSNANLSNANLSSTNLSNASLSNASLFSASLISANLNSANFSTANLSFADLGDASLNGTNLSNANLSDANLSSVNLSFANLNSANFSTANLKNTNLKNANLSRSTLLGTNLRESRGLAPDQFTSPDDSPLLCNTTLPTEILEAGIDPDRDCDRMVEIFRDRYRISPEAAQRRVDVARQKQWD